MYVYLADVRVPIIIMVTPARFTQSWANTVRFEVHCFSYSHGMCLENLIK